MNPIARIATLIFIVFWMAFVFLDYWQKHPVYYHSFHLFQYWGLAFTLLLIGAGVSWFLLKSRKSKKPNPLFRGLIVALLFLFTGVLSAGFAYGKLVEQQSFDAVKAFRVLFGMGGTALAVYLIVVVSYVLGELLEKAIQWRVKPGDAFVVSIAAGMLCLVFCLFLLGAVSLLHSFVVAPLLLVLLLFGRKQALFFVKTTLWQPLTPGKEMNWVGAAGFYLLVVLYGINFVAVIVPMPPGFDAMTLYANLPALIGERHALVEGFQPYNWSVLMSLGHVLFGSTAVSLALSYLGGALSAFAMYALCRNWLGMSVNATFPAILVFSLTPSMTIQSTAELKVDLGLLFILLSVVLIMLNHFSEVPEKTPAPPDRVGEGQFRPDAASGYSAFRIPEPHVAAMGLLSGFALGIKLTTIYFALALVCALWYARCGKRGFFAAFLVGLFLVFFLKTDEIGGLRQYHLGVETLQWGALGAGILLLVGVFLEDKKAWTSSLRSTAIYGAFLVLPFLPWTLKNYLETRSLSPDKLLNGKQASPEINLQTLEQNLAAPPK